MKKKLSLFLVLLILLLPGCSSSGPTQETEDDGTTITHDERGDTYNFESFPRKIAYDNTSFSLDKIEFYEHSFDGYAKSLFVILFFDMNDMSDEDLYWFKSDESTAVNTSSLFERPLRVSLSVDSEQNDFDSENLSLRESFYSSDNFKVMVYQLDNYRYSLAGEHISLSIHVKQGGTYEYVNDDGETSDLDKEDTYYYFNDIPSELGDLNSLQSNNASIYSAIFE